MEEDLSKCPQCGGNADRGIDNCIPPSAYMCSTCCAQEDADKAKQPTPGSDYPEMLADQYLVDRLTGLHLKHERLYHDSKQMV